MKINITAYVVARQYAWDKQPTFSIYPYDPAELKSDSEVLVKEQVFEVEIPDNFDPRPGQIEALNNRKRELQAKFAESVRQIDEQINSLLAIEHKAE